MGRDRVGSMRDSSEPKSPKRLGRARWLVASNALDAGGRSAADVAIDVLAVLVIGVGAEQMGLLLTLSGLGFLFLGVPLGVFVDRYLSPRLLAAAGILKAALLGTLVAAWAADALTFAHLAAVMTILGILTVLAETTQATLIPRVVASSLVGRLAARLESADAALGMIVPAVAGVLVSTMGAGPVVGMSAAFLAAAALVALRIRMSPSAPKVRAATAEGQVAPVVLSSWSNFWHEAREGWSLLRHTPLLWLLTLASMAGNIGLALFGPVEALWILTDLDFGPEFLGLQLTAGAVGALAASLVAERVIDALGERGSVVAGSFGCAVAVALHLGADINRSQAVPLLLAGTALWGFMVILGNITNVALFTKFCPEGVLGRVTATRRTLTRGVVPVATIAGGFLAAWLGVRWVLVCWLVLGLIAWMLTFAASRILRRSD